MITAICFRCKVQFQTENEEAIYGDEYCPPCNESKIRIAKEIDAKLGNRPPQPKPIGIDDLPYDVDKQSANGGRATFIRASKLGF